MQYIAVTGACGGMGRKTVAWLQQQGFGVFALDRELGKAGERVFPLQVDVTDEASVAAAAARIREITDTLYAVVHFAGLYMLDSLVEMDSRDFDRIMAVNVYGAFLVNKAFLPLLKEGSRILMTTSELAPLDPLPFTGIYAVTKGALDRYAYSLCMELQLLGISVSVLRAGAVDTGILGASTRALERFCDRSKLYACNAGRFKHIVESVETRCIPPQKLAEKVGRILMSRNPRFAYSINRNPLLLLLNALPQRWQLRIIRQILR